MEQIWSAIGSNPTILFIFLAFIIVFLGIVILIIVLKPGNNEERNIKLFGNEISIKKNSKGSDFDSNESSQNDSAPVINVNVGNVNSSGDSPSPKQNRTTDEIIDNFKNNFCKLIDNFSSQLDENKTQKENMLNEMRTNYINDAIQDLKFHFTDYFDTTETNFYIKRDMFNLVISFEFNNIMLNKLKTLEKNPQSAYDEMNTMVDDAAKDICKAIENKLDNYVIFSEKESHKKFKDFFESNLSHLSRKIAEFLKSFVRMNNELKTAEKEILEERNKSIGIQIMYLLNLNKSGGGENDK